MPPKKPGAMVWRHGLSRVCSEFFQTVPPPRPWPTMEAPRPGVISPQGENGPEAVSQTGRDLQPQKRLPPEIDGETGGAGAVIVGQHQAVRHIGPGGEILRGLAGDGAGHVVDE